jgi:sulfonate transport system permease protein
LARRVAFSLTGFILPVLIVVAWHIASVSGAIAPYLLPPPSAVVTTLWEMTLNGVLFKHVQASVTRWVVGFILGGGLGLLLGSWVGLSRGAERTLDTSVQMLRTIPFLAMAPLLIIWLGLDEAPKITLVGLAAFFPLYINTFAGIRNVDRKLIEVGRVYQLSGPEMLRRVIIPAALPAVFTGVRYGLGVAWLALVVAELMGATRGLGFMLVEGREFVRIDVIVGGIILFSVVGKVVDTFVRLLEARFLRWRDTYAGG